MYPEDHVLVVYVPQSADFEIIQTSGWYRIPQKHAPKGLHAEYFAFYFGRRFGQEKWAIHYFAPQLGNELTTRLALFPDQPDHPRAQEMYYKVQLGPLQKLPQPIVSLRWRRITFLHSTWDRFQDATEINDLFVDGEPYVDRLYATLKEKGIQAERNYTIRERGVQYVLPLVVFCKNGRIDLTQAQIQQKQDDPAQLAQEIANFVSAVEDEDPLL
ncbi:hypothetical protein [Candidatus Leptofilum sp.]|uniref:hypothetical protein n=1 Tax=Candidatus Leptofilum sp. TaxID=3241576 RepID=UPI003B59BB0B